MKCQFYSGESSIERALTHEFKAYTEASKSLVILQDLVVAVLVF